MHIQHQELWSEIKAWKLPLHATRYKQVALDSAQRKKKKKPLKRKKIAHPRTWHRVGLNKLYDC